MFRTVVALFISVSLGWTAGIPPQDDFTDALTQAESLYYEAKFKASVDLLLRIDEALQPQQGRLAEKVKVKLQMALAYVGLNDVARARSRFVELYGLDPDYSMDPKQFSPKVIKVADEAKLEQNEIRCTNVCNEARKQVDAGNAGVLVDLIGPMMSKCPALADIALDAGELLYKKGLEAYKRGNFADALQTFRSAVKLHPKHELANQYLELTQSKLEITGDRLVIEWRKNFEAGKYDLAADNYKQLASSKVAGTNTLSQIREEYRGALVPFVAKWKQACANRDAATMEAIRAQVSGLVPEASIGEDILAQMANCEKLGCIQIASQVAMTRLKTRVNPEMPPTLRDIARRNLVTVRVHANIDENGNVAVIETQGGNSMLNRVVGTAVGQWKFYPTIVDNVPRCVETQIPIVFGSGPTDTSAPQ